jgi:hypothetical protein
MEWQNAETMLHVHRAARDGDGSRLHRLGCCERDCEFTSISLVHIYAFHLLYAICAAHNQCLRLTNPG